MNEHHEMKRDEMEWDKLFTFSRASVETEALEGILF